VVKIQKIVKDPNFFQKTWSKKMGYLAKLHHTTKRTSKFDRKRSESVAPIKRIELPIEGGQDSVRVFYHNRTFISKFNSPQAKLLKPIELPPEGDAPLEDSEAEEAEGETDKAYVFVNSLKDL